MIDDEQTEGWQPQKTKEEIRPDSDLAPAPVAELGEIARVNATGQAPEGPAKPVLEAGTDEDG